MLRSIVCPTSSRCLHSNPSTLKFEFFKVSACQKSLFSNSLTSATFNSTFANSRETLSKAAFKSKLNVFMDLKNVRLLSSTSSESLSDFADPNNSYHGPLTRTFRRLKLFSLSSFMLASLLTPFMFVIESSLPFQARAALASTAILSSGLSTGLIAWCGRPYVSQLRVLVDSLNNSGEKMSIQAIELYTSTMFLRPLVTKIYDPLFLSETRRPFAKWELTQNVTLPVTELVDSVNIKEETIAETADASGRIIGRWIVTWNKHDDGKMVGTCRAVGRVVRNFNVHEEILPPSLRHIAIGQS